MLPCACFAQVMEDFSDGDFTENPTWLGTDSCFKVNANGQLQLNATTAGVAYLSVPFRDCLDMEWRFWIRENFSPSTNNYADVYLVADTSNLEAVRQGYFLRFGAAGNLDALELYRKDPSGEQLICKGADSHVASAFKMGVKVVCDHQGNWKVLTDNEYLGDYVLEAAGNDSTYALGGFFGFLLRYTSSNGKKFYFDDIYVGPEVIDTEPPKVVGLSVEDEHHLLLTFNEPVARQALDSRHYAVQPDLGPPDTVVFADRPSIVRLVFALPFKENFSYLIIVTGVEDLSGNQMIDSSCPFAYYHPSENDVVLNEIMADPSPVVDLPEWEYVELFNATDFPIDLKDWTLTIGTSVKVFTSTILEPQSYLILCKTEAEREFSTYGKTFAFASFSIANAGATLRMAAPDETVVSEVSFNDNWYRDPDKKQGGWSLEQIDPFNPCAGADNWSASQDPSGGTPGRENSINAPNETLPSVERMSMLGDNTLFLWFDQQMDRASVADASHYHLESLDVYPTEVIVNPNNAANVELVFQVVFEEGKVYTLTVNEVANCNGQLISPNTRLDFGLPHTIGPGEILINEILFDPISPGVDYVELYNVSEKTFDMAELKLGVIKDRFPNPSDTTLREITENSNLFLPHSYLLLSTDGRMVARQYECVPENFVDMNSFPSFSNSGGMAFIISREGVVIDQMEFSESMHYPLLKETKGVSLERVSWELPSSQLDNWHSAAESVHFGTPGYLNSMGQHWVETEGEVSVAPTVFSPDGDGFDDHAVIHYSLEKAGCTVNAYVFSVEGRLVRHLVKGELVGQEGGFAWNGLDEKGNRVPLGLYVIVTEVLDLQGVVTSFKNAVGVASR